MPRLPSRAGFDNATQRELTWWLAQGASKEDAARRAGLRDADRVYAFTRTKEFAHELRTALLDHMATDLSPKAVRILDEIMSDNKVHPRVRVDAAKALLDRSGLSVVTTAPKPVDTRLNEMSDAELQAHLQMLRQKRDALEITIEGEVMREPSTAVATVAPMALANDDRDEMLVE